MDVCVLRGGDILKGHPGEGCSSADAFNYITEEHLGSSDQEDLVIFKVLICYACLSSTVSESLVCTTAK